MEASHIDSMNFSPMALTQLIIPIVSLPYFPFRNDNDHPPATADGCHQKWIQPSDA